MLTDERIFWAVIAVSLGLVAYGFVVLGPELGRVARFVVAELEASDGTVHRIGRATAQMPGL